MEQCNKNFISSSKECMTAQDMCMKDMDGSLK